MEFTEGMCIFIEMKDEESEEEHKEMTVEEVSEKAPPTQPYEDINDSPNLRTVLACHEDEPGKVETLIINI